ncbi:MAG TPA: DoxX family protein [Rhodopila sp.]|nr:DoxX family protein [Rhodopila sp.]
MSRTNSQDLGALLLRVTLGALFLVHAALKIFVFTIPGTVGFFMKLGLPGPLAYAVIALEVFGGLALILGVQTRIVSLLLAADLVGAIATVHLANGFFFNAPGGGWEYPAFWAIMLVVQILIGDGAYALSRSRTPA